MENTTDFPGKQTSNGSTLTGDVERRSHRLPETFTVSTYDRPILQV